MRGLSGLWAYASKRLSDTSPGLCQIMVLLETESVSIQKPELVGGDIQLFHKLEIIIL